MGQKKKKKNRLFLTVGVLETFNMLMCTVNFQKIKAVCSPNFLTMELFSRVFSKTAMRHTLGNTVLGPPTEFSL